MTKLSDLQLVLLSKASQRQDRALEPPAARAAGVASSLASLLKRALIAEVPTAAGMPVWLREDETNAPRSFVVTDLGLIAIGVLTDDGPAVDEQSQTSTPPRAREAKLQKPGNAAAPNGSSKTDAVVKLLQRKEGASITALIEATGWLPHSTRAALTGLRKKGFDIERGKAKDKTTTVYRIVEAPAAGKAA